MKMKKLMFMLGAAVAVAVQAGQVKWNSGEIFTAGKDGSFTTSSVADGAVNGYLWMVTETIFNSYKDVYDDKGYAEMAKTVYADYKDKTGTASKSGVSAAGAITLTDGKTYSNGDDVYAVLLYTMTQGDKDYYIANIGDYTAKTAAKTVYDMATMQLGGGTSGTENAITGWSDPEPPIDTPEPTSGLLMLIGAAGLALRRKRV